MSIDGTHFRNFMEGDEVVWRIPQGLEFGRILAQDGDKMFKVDVRKEDGTVTKDFNLLQEDDVALVDREHSEGGSVIDKDGMVGEIVDSNPRATIRIPDCKCIVENVPLAFLETMSVQTKEIIFYKGWIGKISSVEYNVVVEYGNGTQGIMVQRQLHKSHGSLGYTQLDKVTAPYIGMEVIPTAKEFKTMEWLGQGVLDSVKHLFHSLKGSKGHVKNARIIRVFVNWVVRIDNGPEDEEAPNPMLEGQQLYDVSDFDIVFKTWRKSHSLCQYISRGNEITINEDAIMDYMTESLGLLKHGPDAASKRVKTSNIEYSKRLVAGKKYLVEVLRVQNWYNVMFRDGSLRQLPGSLLSPESQPSPILSLEPFQMYEREFVDMKSVLDDECKQHEGDLDYAVAGHRDLKNAMVVVDLYDTTHKHLERKLVSKYDIKCHSRYGGIKKGAITIKRDSPCSTETVGMILRVNNIGLVEVYGHDGFVTMYSPKELMVKNIVARVLPLPTAISVCPEEQLRFIERLVRDWREFEDSAQEDIRIKPKCEDKITSFSVLMKGPEKTPYEDGLFVFGVELPHNYPTVPPIVNLESTPSDGSAISYNIKEDCTVLHPRLENFEPEKSKEARWGWDPNISLLDFMKELREDIFEKEPFLSKPGLRFMEKKRILQSDPKLMAKVITMNAEIMITTVEMLIEMKNSGQPFWEKEIKQHLDKTSPKFIEKYCGLLSTHKGIHNPQTNELGFCIVPVSTGFAVSLVKRIKLLGGNP